MAFLPPIAAILLSTLPTLFEETLTASRGGKSLSNKEAMRGNGSRIQGVWFERTVEIPAGTTYLAFRHFNCSDNFVMNVDDVTITANAAPNANSALSNVVLTPGTFYVVAAAETEFTVNLEAENLPCPEQAVCVYPLDNADDVTSPVTLKWQLDLYATEYRLVFGSTYYCEDVLVDWTDELATSYTVSGLYNNTNYFWRVDQRNNGNCEDGVTGEVWGFTTTLNIPQNLRAESTEIYEGDDLVLLWDPIQDRTFRQYNIYQDGQLIGHIPTNTTITTYTVEDLSYEMDGYEFNVTALYDEGESDFSNTVTVMVSGEGSVSGTVYEQDCTTGIAGATVTFIGEDEFGVARTYSFTTDAQGDYSGDLLAGEYNGKAVTITMGTNPNPNPTPSGDILGAVIFRDGEYLAFTEDATYTDMAPAAGEHEYCVRVVYNGANALPDSNFYYAMSCPDCVTYGGTTTCEPGAPITGVYKWNAPDNFGSLISWGENIQPIAEWLYYDDGTYSTSIGFGAGGGVIYWGSMFPAASLTEYAGTNLTKVALFENEYNTSPVTVNIYLGGTTAPATLVSTQEFNPVGGEAFHEVTLTTPVGIDGTRNLWITFNENGTYPANACEDTGEANNRWVSEDGSEWVDLATAGLTGYGWMIRGFVTNSRGGMVENIALEPAPMAASTATGTLGHTEVVNKPADLSFMNRAEITKYNVYRSTENANYSLIGSVNAVAGQTYYEYFDAVNAINTYYYQVKAEYDNGCESEPAQSAVNPANNYVTVNVTSIGQFDDEVNLYPNPTSGNVTIQATGMNRITVVNALGQVVYDAEIENDMTTLNMGQFTSGVYMVRIATATGVSVKRVTVVK